MDSVYGLDAAAMQIVGHGFARTTASCHFTEPEKMKLVEEVEKRRAIVRARFNRDVTSEDKRQAWKEITAAVNSVNPHARHTQTECKKKWDNMMVYSKKLYWQYKQKLQEAEVRGGRLPRQLSDVVLRVINVIGEEAVEESLKNLSEQQRQIDEVRNNSKSRQRFGDTQAIWQPATSESNSGMFSDRTLWRQMANALILQQHAAQRQFMTNGDVSPPYEDEEVDRQQTLWQLLLDQSANGMAASNPTFDSGSSSVGGVEGVSGASDADMDDVETDNVLSTTPPQVDDGDEFCGNARLEQNVKRCLSAPPSEADLFSEEKSPMASTTLRRTLEAMERVAEAIAKVQQTQQRVLRMKLRLLRDQRRLTTIHPYPTSSIH